MYQNFKQNYQTVFNPNKAGLFEGSFSWGGEGGESTYLKYVESEKMLRSSVISWFISFFVTR